MMRPCGLPARRQTTRPARSIPSPSRSIAAFTLRGDAGDRPRIEPIGGDAAMPASFGFHPAFAWPLPYGAPREDHRIVFDLDEPGSAQDRAGGLIAGPRPSPLDGRTCICATICSSTTRWSGTGPVVQPRDLWCADRPAARHRLPRHAEARHLDQARRALCLHRAVARHRRSRSASPATSATSPACSRSRRAATGPARCR
jgi:hypothetical protein